MSRDEFCAANRRDWDERVAIHRRDTTGFYGVERFLARKTTARDRQRRARRDCLRRTAGGQRRIRRRVHDLGTICWLPDIVRWAETIASLFAPDGAFYFADAHPAMLVLEEREGRLVAKWAADTPIDEPLVFDEAQTYTGDPDAAHCVAHLPVDPFAAANSQGADGDRARPRFCSRASLVALAAVSHVHPERQRHLLPRGAPAVPLAVSLRAIKRGIGRT